MQNAGSLIPVADFLISKCPPSFLSVAPQKARWGLEKRLDFKIIWTNVHGPNKHLPIQITPGFTNTSTFRKLCRQVSHYQAHNYQLFLQDCTVPLPVHSKTGLYISTAAHCISLSWQCTYNNREVQQCGQV